MILVSIAITQGGAARTPFVFEDSKFGTGRHEFSFELASIDEIPQLAEGI